MADWGFLTNHGRALLCIAHDPGVRLREIADILAITERSAYSIVTDLAAAGYIVKERDGRRNRYVIQHHLSLREPTARERTIGEVLDLLVGPPPRRRATGAAKLTASKDGSKAGPGARARASTRRADERTDAPH